MPYFVKWLCIESLTWKQTNPINLHLSGIFFIQTANVVFIFIMERVIILLTYEFFPT